MGLFKGKSGYWKYDFWFKKRRFQGSTKLKNINLARQFEAKLRSDLALGEVGLSPDRKTPLFASHMTDSFLPYVERHAKKRKTADSYRDRTKRILKFEPWKTLRLNQINGAEINKYTAWSAKGVEVATVNGDLRTLRKALRLAEEWGLIEKAPKVRLLPGENFRDFVISPQLEADYLAIAPYPLAQAVVLMLDLGLRPEECVRLHKSDITPDILLVREGKTTNAARSLPLTERSLHIVQLCSALFPSSEFLFPGKVRGHYSRQSLDNAHRRFCRRNGFPEDFDLHSCRHTFATRLAESGADVHAIKELLGHATVKMATHYVHVGREHLAIAVKRMEMMQQILRGDGGSTDHSPRPRYKPTSSTHSES